MGVSFHVAANESQIAELRADLAGIPNGLERVIVRGTNKVSVATRTQIVRGVVEEVNLTAGEVRDRNVSLFKANFTTLSARIFIFGRRIPLIRWGAHDLRKSRGGVSYAIRRGGRQTLPHAFIATMESGYIGVFIRRDAAVTAGIRLPDGDAEVATNERSRVVGVAGRVGTAPIRPYRNGQLRDRHGLPIVELFGPSVPAVVEGIAELAQATLDNKIASDLHAELATQAGLVLQGRAAPAAEAAE